MCYVEWDASCFPIPMYSVTFRELLLNVLLWGGKKKVISEQEQGAGLAEMSKMTDNNKKRSSESCSERDLIDRKWRTSWNAKAWVNVSERREESSLSGDFTRKEKWNRSLAAFQLTSSSSSTVGLSALGAAVVQRLLCTCQAAMLVFWEYSRHHCLFPCKLFSVVYSLATPLTTLPVYINLTWNIQIPSSTRNPNCLPSGSWGVCFYQSVYRGWCKLIQACPSAQSGGKFRSCGRHGWV